MILKSTILHNIRSYQEPTSIEFSKGSSLFEGDIGSGKSTILLGIEFALFGLGDIDPKFLLRAGQKEGSVELEFEVNGKNYTVFRSLVRRGRGVVQGVGYIVEEGTRTDYSVAEMKSRILKILDFKERPQPRTSSLIYRYAIFTPQEEMKQVLLQSADRRLETLRRAFGIEEYSSAAKNTEFFVSQLRTETRVLEERTRDIPEKVDEQRRAKESVDTIAKAIATVSDEIQNLQNRIDQLDSKLSKLQPMKELVIKLEEALPRIRKEIAEREKEAKRFDQRLVILNADLREIGEAERTLQALRPSHQKYIEYKKELKSLEPPMSKLRGLENQEGKLEKSIEKEGEGLGKKVVELQREIKERGKSLALLERTIGKKGEIEQQVSTLARQVSELKGVSKRTEYLGRKIAQLEQDLKNKERELAKKQKEWREIQKIGIGAPCPRCKQKLTKDHFETVRSSYGREFGELKAQISEGREAINGLSISLETVEAQKDTLSKKIDQLDKLKQTLVRIAERRKVIEKERQAIQNKRFGLDQSKQAFSKNVFAPEERKELQQIQAVMSKLYEQKKRYDNLRAKVDELEKGRIEARFVEAASKAKRTSLVSKEIKQTSRALVESVRHKKARLREFDVKTRKYEKNKGVIPEIGRIESEKQGLETQRNRQGEERAAKRKEMEGLDKRVAELEGEITQKREDLRIKDIYSQVRIWLDQYFLPAVQDIERHVLASINEEFNQLFQRWFTSLIETGDISVRVDEDFAPIIAQAGYELAFDSLSGGERTAVALAYRLAVNVMVKKVCEAMHSNLLMLDEPTDGFSKEQLSKLRDVLDELKCEQVIMVSHERELESFVDRVYRVRKEGTVSRIEA